MNPVVKKIVDLASGKQLNPFSLRYEKSRHRTITLKDNQFGETEKEEQKISINPGPEMGFFCSSQTDAADLMEVLANLPSGLRKMELANLPSGLEVLATMPSGLEKMEESTNIPQGLEKVGLLKNHPLGVEKNIPVNNSCRCWDFYQGESCFEKKAHLMELISEKIKNIKEVQYLRLAYRETNFEKIFYSNEVGFLILKTPIHILQLEVTLGESQQVNFQTSLGGYWFCGEEDFLKEVNFLKEYALTTSLTNLKGEKLEKGSYPVIIDSSLSQLLIHEACGHFLEGDMLLRQNSPFQLKDLGKKVSSFPITISDNGGSVKYLGCTPFDDEGIISSSTVLIDKGVLKNILVNKNLAEKLHVPLSGNARAEDVCILPQIRMTTLQCTIEENYTTDNLLKKMNNGIFLKGAKDLIVRENGDFVLNIMSGYEVKDGQLKKPLKNIIYQDNIRSFLNKIIGGGTDFHYYSGMCYKGGLDGSGQNIWVSNGAPSLLLDEVTLYS